MALNVSALGSLITDAFDLIGILIGAFIDLLTNHLLELAIVVGIIAFVVFMFNWVMKQVKSSATRSGGVKMK